MTYHYTLCGLDYVVLHSGYRFHETEYGDGVSIERTDDLDRVIAVRVITSHARIRGQEVRFLRSLTEFSQTDVANLLGVKRITIARWEGAPNTPVPGPADRVLRLLFAYHILGADTVAEIPELLSEISDERPSTLYMSYLPDEEDDGQDSMFPEEKPTADRWRPASTALAN